MSDFTGPVSASETQAIIHQLRDLAHRAAENKQRLFHFVLSTGADSLDDNLQTLTDIGSDSDE